MKDINELILEKVGEAAVLEGLAEEAVELAHAALKYARILRGENPTPVNLGEAANNLKEEYADVTVYARVAGLKFDPDNVYIERNILLKKMRWLDRLNINNEEVANND